MKLHILNDIANNVEWTQYVIIASLKSEPMGKLINRIPGLRLLISSLPGMSNCETSLKRYQMTFTYYFLFIFSGLVSSSVRAKLPFLALVSPLVEVKCT